MEKSINNLSDKESLELFGNTYDENKDNEIIKKNLIISGDENKIKEVCDYITKHYKDEITIDDNFSQIYWEQFIRDELECNDIKVNDEKIEELRDDLFNNDQFIEDLRLYITELINENLEE